MSYSGAWNGSGQIPRRPDRPDLPRSHLHAVGLRRSDRRGPVSAPPARALTFRARPTPNDEFALLLYTFAYSATIFSDFTFFLNDPVHGDEIEQDDARTVTGLRATWRNRVTLGDWHFTTTAGTTLRIDDIDNGLHHDMQRERLSDLVVDHVVETGLGFFAEEQIAPTSRIRLVLGAREDAISFNVTDERTGLAMPDPTRNGSTTAAQFSPKASLVLTPVRDEHASWDLYVNLGRGFHSNDGRGVVIPPTPALTAQCSNAMAVPVGINCPRGAHYVRDRVRAGGHGLGFGTAWISLRPGGCSFSIKKPCGTATPA